MPGDDYMREVTIGELEELNGTITISDYDPDWPHHYAALAADLTRRLGDGVCEVHHVGSTSVPGLAAKPIIDIDLIVADPTNEDDYVPALEELGYRLRVREPDWHQHRLLRLEDPISGNLHVFGPGARPHVGNLVFRDRLRDNAGERQWYEDTKRALARQNWRYVQHYADAKTDVVTRILARAGHVRLGDHGRYWHHAP